METRIIPKYIGFEIAMLQAMEVPEDRATSYQNLPQKSSELSTGAWITIGAIVVIAVAGSYIYYLNKTAEKEKSSTHSNRQN